jgi:predicted dehydrogenase/threonine dehydrogenase-like Zn-dependent dehydrogenase
MRQLIQSYRSGEMRLEEVPPPSLRAGGALVATSRSLVSAGTEKMLVDLARKSLLAKARSRPDLVSKVIATARKQGVANTLRTVQTKLDTPIPLGYSAAGIVLELGEGVEGLRVGDRVACAGAGYANHAEVNFVPRNLLARMPEGVSMDAGAFATVGAIALQGVRQAGPSLGDRVAVLGLGLIGQLSVQLLRANGCRVLGFDPMPARAKLGQELGAHVAVSEDLEGAAERFSRGHGLDAVIVAAAARDAGPLTQAGEIARLRGRVVVVGMVGMEIPRSIYYRKELEVRMSMSYGPGRYDPNYEERGIDYPLPYVRWTEGRNLEAFLDLVGDESLHVSPLISHRFPIERALAAYDLISGGGEPYLGVLLEYAEDDQGLETARPRIELREAPATSGKVRIGLIGAGSFGSAVILPSIRKAGLAENVGIVSASGMTARRIGDQHGFRYAAASAEALIASDEIDAVFVLTRHHLHAPLCIAALQAGKAVFCEKPLALSTQELDEVSRVAEATGGRVMVGFNRRFAPLVGGIADHFRGRTEPLLMHYRVNAGYVPEDHWVHDPVEGGGRILGEVCHFVDLLQHLAGAPPIRVRAEPIQGGGRYRTDDNVSITLAFGDGSVGSILYTSMGDPRLSKERLEVFGEGRVAVLDDFRSLELVAGGRSRRQRSANQDKGFDEEIRLTLEAVKAGGSMPIPFEELRATTRATLAVLAALRSGQAQPV